MFGPVTLQTKGLVPVMPKISVFTLMVSQVKPKDSADPSEGLRQRNTGDDVRFELEGTNYQLSAPFVDYIEPDWERTSASWMAQFDSVMENET